MYSSWSTLMQQWENEPFAAIRGLEQQVDDHQEEVFSTDSCFSIYNLSEGINTTASQISSQFHLDEYLQKPLLGTTIVSIDSDRTNAPLNISYELAGHLFKRLGVRRDFLRIVLAFGKGPQQTDAGYSSEDYRSLESGQYVVSYKLNFFEKNARGGRNPWSSRHAGIYHHHKSDSDLFIILNCVRQTSFRKNLQTLIQSGATSGQPGRLSGIAHNPELLHVMLLHDYFDNWKYYLDTLGTKFEKINDHGMVATAGHHMGRESFDRVQHLRHLFDQTLFADACCDNNSRVASMLKSEMMFSKACVESLNAMIASFSGFRNSSKVLQKRVQNAIDMVGYSLTHHNQQETAKLEMEMRDMTKHMETLAQENRDLIERMKNLAQDTSLVTRKLHELQQDTVDDSGIVMIITVASVIYLPGSFVGTIFGMNFFDFDSTTRRIVIGDNFWIFVVMWLLFLIITVVIFMVAWWVKKRDLPRPWRRQRPKGVGPAA